MALVVTDFEMDVLKRNWKYITLCVLTVASILGLFGNASLWQVAIGPMHNIEKTDYPFHDMGARLVYAERVAEGVDVNHNSGNNKPLYTVYMMQLLGLDRSSKIPVSLFFVGLFTFWNLWLLRIF